MTLSASVTVLALAVIVRLERRETGRNVKTITCDCAALSAVPAGARALLWSEVFAQGLVQRAEASGASNGLRRGMLSGSDVRQDEVIVTRRSMDYEALVQSAGDAIVAAGRDGSILLWNRAAERLFGYSEQEALGRSLDLIVPERLRSRHWEGYGGVMRSGRTRYGTQVLQVPAVDREGRPLSIAFTVTLLRSPRGTVEAIAAIIRDDTSRWKEERALRQRIAELEARCE